MRSNHRLNYSRRRGRNVGRVSGWWYFLVGSAVLDSGCRPDAVTEGVQRRVSRLESASDSDSSFMVSARTGFRQIDRDTRIEWRRVVTRSGAVEDTFRDSSGSVLARERVDEMVRAAAERRLRIQGHMTDALAAALAGRAPTDQLRVSVWLATSRVPRRLPFLDPLPCDEVRTLRARVATRLGRSNNIVTSDACPSPLLELDISARDAHDLAFSDDVASVDVHRPLRPQSYWWHDSMQVPAAHVAGWNGQGVRVGILEAANYSTTLGLSGIIGVFQPNGLAHSHARAVTSIIRQDSPPYGVAPAASILLANMTNAAGTSTDFSGANDWLFDNGAQVVNSSNGPSDYYDGTPTGTDREYDWRTLQFPYPLYVVAAGNYILNQSEFVGNRSYNTVSVGSSTDIYAFTTSRADDQIASFSCWRNYTSPNGDRELPEIVALGECLETIAGQCIHGTSISAPIITGAVALMTQRNSFSLASGNWPEAQKAILMASADCNVHGPLLNLNDTVDDRDGVGEANVANAVQLADPSNRRVSDTPATGMGFRYGYIYPAQFFQGYWTSRPRVRTNESGWINVVLAWDATPVCTPTSAGLDCSQAHAPDADFNLLLIDPVTSTAVASSASVDNTYEVVNAQLNPNTDYEVVVQASSWRLSSTYYGLAWSNFSQKCNLP